MRKRKRIVSAATALALTAGLVLCPFGWREPALAVTQADIDAMKDDLDVIADQIDQLEDQLAQVQTDKAKALEQKRLLDEQVALITRQIADTDAVLAEYDGLIAAKEAEIADIEAKERAQYELFCAQVRSMEERGTVSYLSILFDSSEFTELLDRAMMIGEIMDYNNEIIDLLLDTRAQLQTAKEELEGERADQQAIRDQQAANQAELEVQQAEAAALAQKLIDQESEYEAAVQALEEEDARIEQEMKDAQRQLAAQNAGIVSETGWYWPVPGFYTLTSGFGWRTHPVYGTQRYHNGTDIGGAGINGTAIGAAKSGVVTTSKYSSSYGNYVVVSHSDGYQTLYAHMSSRAVSEGDIVTQGQTLGYVGTTGVSTGPHLHYEVWYNGSRTDAEQYYPNLESVFYRKYNAA